MLAALGIAGAARAGDAPSATDVGELMKRIEKLEASNRALASEVETLREEATKRGSPNSAPPRFVAS